MTRPVDNIGRIADYIYWLLPAFLKRKERGFSLIGALVDSFGEELDEARATLRAVTPLTQVETAVGAFLDRLGRQRQTERLAQEEDDEYRRRIIAAWTEKQRQGSIPGLKASLALLGYTIEIWEYRAISRALFTPPENAQDRDTYIVAEAKPQSWDDGGAFDDGGHFDDRTVAEAEWAGHEGELTMWSDGEWRFLTPWAGMIVKVCDENASYGRLYRFDGQRWIYREAGSQWSHFVVQVKSAEEEARSQADFNRILRAQKAAHTRPIITSELEAGTWDDEAYLDDGGPLDDWIL